MNSTTTFINQSTGATSYSWSPSIGLSCDNCPNPFASPLTTTMYLVEGLNDLGCTGIASVIIYVNQLIPETFIPNVFTPNADESNDYFSVTGFEDYTDFQVLILNRWGNVMFSSSIPSFKWNGEDQNGVEAKDGVYFYLITGTSPYDQGIKEFQGFVHLVR